MLLLLFGFLNIATTSATGPDCSSENPDPHRPGCYEDSLEWKQNEAGSTVSRLVLELVDNEYRLVGGDCLKEWTAGDAVFQWDTHVLAQGLFRVPEDDYFRIKEWKVCDQGDGILEEGTASKDVVCGPCVDNMVFPGDRKRCVPPCSEDPAGSSYMGCVRCGDSWSTVQAGDTISNLVLDDDFSTYNDCTGDLLIWGTEYESSIKVVWDDSIDLDAKLLSRQQEGNHFRIVSSFDIMFKESDEFSPVKNDVVALFNPDTKIFELDQIGTYALAIAKAVASGESIQISVGLDSKTIVGASSDTITHQADGSTVGFVCSDAESKVKIHAGVFQFTCTLTPGSTEAPCAHTKTTGRRLNHPTDTQDCIGSSFLQYNSVTGTFDWSGLVNFHASKFCAVTESNGALSVEICDENEVSSFSDAQYILWDQDTSCLDECPYHTYANGNSCTDCQPGRFTTAKGRLSESDCYPCTIPSYTQEYQKHGCCTNTDIDEFCDNSCTC